MLIYLCWISFVTLSACLAEMRVIVNLTFICVRK